MHTLTSSFFFMAGDGDLRLELDKCLKEVFHF